MASNRVSTEGCKTKWRQRGPRTTKKKNEETVQSLVEKVLREMSGPSAAKPVAVCSFRPDDDGIVHRTSKRRKTKQQSAPSRNSQQPMDIIPHTLEIQEKDKGDKDLDMFIKELLENGNFQPTTWQNRQKETDTDWKGARSFMMARLLELQSPLPLGESIHCFSCCRADAVVQCDDCMGSYLCEKCDYTIHACNPFHDRRAPRNGYFENLPQEFFFPMTQHCEFQCQHCDRTDSIDVEDGTYIAITVKGRFDIPKKKRVCTHCNKFNTGYELANVIQRGFWPANPDLQKSRYIFEMTLLSLWHQVYRNLPGSSLHGFIGALGDISVKNGRKRAINQTVFSRVISEFGYMESEMALLKGQDPLQCPACASNQLMCHMDGNHKLYRYKSVSRGEQEAYYLDKFIVKDSKVADHVRNVYTVHPTKSASYQDIYCGTSKWKAAREASSSYKKLDETGLVVAGCRHAIAQKAVNMFAGELYAYSHYLHVNFLFRNGIKFIWQDIVCKYWPWANKVATGGAVWKAAVTATTPALSVMHAKAHSWHCQVCWGGRYKDGAGAGSGEDMEQLFSYLSRIGNTTKHMSAAKRIDTITDHVMFWNSRKINALPELLCKRYKRMKITLDETDKQLQQMTGCVEANDRNKLLESWAEDVLKAGRDSNQPVATIRKKEEKLQRYFVLSQHLREGELLKQYVAEGTEGLSSLIGSEELFQLASKKSKNIETVKGEMKSLEDSLCSAGDNIVEQGKYASYMATVSNLQREIELTITSINQRRHAIRDLADTSKQRAKLRAVIERDKRRINVMIDKLHHVQVVLDVSAKKNKLDDVMAGKFLWQAEGEIDLATKRKATDLFMTQKRLHEEGPLLIREMKNYLQYFVGVGDVLQKEIHTLKSKLDKLESEDNSVNRPEDLADNMHEGDAQDLGYIYLADEHSTTTQALRGLIGVKHQGLNEAKSKIEWAVTCFKRVTSLDGWKSMILDTEEIYEPDDDPNDVEDGVLVLSPPV